MSASTSSTSSTVSSVDTVVADVRAELESWFDKGDDATGIRFGETRYIPLRVFLPLARAYFVREYDEDVCVGDIEDAVRSMRDARVEYARLVWDGQWTYEEFVIGAGFRNGGGNDAGWAEFVADVMEWADGEYDDDIASDSVTLSDSDSYVESETESDDEDASSPPPSAPVSAPVTRGLFAKDIARFVGFVDSGFVVGETKYAPVLDFQIAVLTLAKESGEFGDNPFLHVDETERFAAANGFLVMNLTMPWEGVWKNADYIVGVGFRD